MAIEIDETGHMNRKEEDKEREKKNHLKCKFIRINPDKQKFDVFDEIGKIYDSIDKIKEEKTKKLVDKIKKRQKISKQEQKAKHRNSR